MVPQGAEIPRHKGEGRIFHPGTPGEKGGFPVQRKTPWLFNKGQEISGRNPMPFRTPFFISGARADPASVIIWPVF
jgi:hypothetical protein